MSHGCRDPDERLVRSTLKWGYTAFLDVSLARKRRTRGHVAKSDFVP
jgi:hypothetical protein